MSKTTLSNALCLSGAVDFPHLALILPAFTPIFTRDDWQKIAGADIPIFIENVLHLPCPFHCQQLPCLFRRKTSNRYSGLFFQVRHVDEGHSARAETEDKHVSGKIQVGIPWQIQFFYLSYLVNHDTSFHSLIHAAINMPERKLKKFDSQTCHQM